METRMTLGGAERFSRFFVAEPAKNRGSVYLDTSVPSYLAAKLSRNFAIARDQRITHMWWSEHRQHFTAYTSEIVITEAEAGDPVYAQLRLAILRGLPTLKLTAAAYDLSRRLLTEAALPLKAANDAHHVAIAAASSIDFLLTWNCKHLANEMMANKIARTCEAAGFRCPTICTPESLMRTFAHEKSYP